GGLAAAGGAEQAADVAGVQVQVEPLDDALALVAAGQVAQRQQQSAHSGRQPGAISISISAFCACRRFFACCQASERGSSSRSSLISSPRWAGRQCRKITLGSAASSRARSTW